MPEILSPDEVARLIDAADSRFHRAMLMTLYATGARRAEAPHLKVGDIDSRRMVVHIHGGNVRLWDQFAIVSAASTASPSVMKNDIMISF